MRNIVLKRILRHVMCLLGIGIFLMCVNQTSFAHKEGHDKGEVFFHSINNDNDKDGGDDEGEDGGGNEDGEEGDDEGTHNAGENCLTSGCHSDAREGENEFSIGGTIYTDADGTDARTGAKIKVVDTNGTKVTLKSDQLGNFYTGKGLEPPYTISVSYQGRIAKMPGSASQGGCNDDSCHSADGVGRIFISTDDLDLTGTVTDDDTGEAVSDATVTLKRMGKVKYSTTTNSAGEFTISAVKAGKYKLKVSADGYETYTESYQMSQSNVSSLEITLTSK